MAKGTSNDRPGGRDPLNPADWFAEPFAAAPLWFIQQTALLPPWESRITWILFAEYYGSQPRGAAIDLVEIARRAQLSQEAARGALNNRIAAGWVHEPGPGKFRLRPELIKRERPEGEHEPDRPRRPDPTPSEYRLDEALYIPRPLTQAWNDYLDNTELRIVFDLVASSWGRGQIDARQSVRDLAGAKGRRPPPDRELRVRRALKRLILMEVLWRIEAPGDRAPETPGIYRLNREWDRWLQEP